MIAVDTQILVYAHRGEAIFHKQSITALLSLAESKEQWAIPWPCVYEFINITTHKKIYSPPSTTEDAFKALNAWRASPSLIFIGESGEHFDRFESLGTKANIIGPLVHDAKIATICLANGVDQFWTIDRDFSRFPDLKTKNPLIIGV